MPLKPVLILIMGPSGVGKSTVGRMLADQLDSEFVDADDHCPSENRAKMAKGIALTDKDRIGWHQLLNTLAREFLSCGSPVVLACSAHRQTHRDTLLSGITNYRIVYLYGTLEIVRNRVAARNDHFFPESLVADQFSIMEPPADAIWLDVSDPPEDLVLRALEFLAH